MERKCVQCGKVFTLTDSEIAFYKSKNLSLPKRCKACRDENRKLKNNMKSTMGKNSHNSTSVDAEMNNQYHKQKPKRASSPVHYIISFLIIVAIGLITIRFGDFANPANYVDKSLEKVMQQYEYPFTDSESLQSHFAKHGHEFGYETAEEYLKGANDVIKNPSSLHKVEAEDGDDCYYLYSTNEFVVVSPEGEIRTYFKPDDGISYFNRQMKTVYHFLG